jgi:predicted RNase H-like nuclease (RuvC/YqgF family)
MQQIGTLVKGIEIKTGQLKDKLDKLKSAYRKLEEEYHQLEKINEQYKQSIQELETKLQALKIAKAIPKGKESSDARKKINELLREIDRCIDLLNNHPI